MMGSYFSYPFQSRSLEDEADPESEGRTFKKRRHSDDGDKGGDEPHLHTPKK